MLKVGNKIKNYFHEFCKEIDIKVNDDYRVEGKYLFHCENLWNISTNLISERFILDKNGVILTKYPEPIGLQYNPAYVAYYGLINFNRYLDTKELKYIEKFNSSLDWIRKNAILFKYKNIICKKFVYGFEWMNGESVLKKGWCSAMAQGLIASLLIRGYYYYDDNNFLELAKETINLFSIDIENGGVRAKFKEYIYFEEYPSYPLSMVLDGALFALVGIYELSKIDSSYKADLEKGLAFIEDNFFIWNYNNRWTKYGVFNKNQFLSTNSYHQLNLILLDFFKNKKLLNIPDIKVSNKYLMAIINFFIIIKSKT